MRWLCRNGLSCKRCQRAQRLDCNTRLVDVQSRAPVCCCDIYFCPYNLYEIAFVSFGVTAEGTRCPVTSRMASLDWRRGRCRGPVVQYVSLSGPPIRSDVRFQFVNIYPPAAQLVVRGVCVGACNVADICVVRAGCCHCVRGRVLLLQLSGGQASAVG